MKTYIPKVHHLTLVMSLALSGCAFKSYQSTTKASSHIQPIQQIVDKAVADAKQALNPKGITIVVAEPSTGKILAISAWRKDTTPELRNHRGWASWVIFEPGSTFKPVVTVAALEKGVVSQKTKINCENGLIRYQQKFIKDHTPMGEATIQEILSKSSNIGAFKMALMLKDEDYYNVIQNFGFGKKTGISVPMEISGLLNPPSRWLALTKARMSWGQSVAVSPIQLTMAYCALANGGKLMRPVVGEQKPKVVRRVCSESTANLVKNALQKTVSVDGAAPQARIEGVTVAGMAGTAQSISSKGDYLPDQYWTMFAGFFPVVQPKYVAIVVVDEAKLPPSKNFGRLVAAPIFSQITAKIIALQGAGIQ